MRVDAPRALADVRDAERHQLLGLHRERALGERLLVELEPCPIGVRCQLAHAAEHRLHVDSVESHGRSPRVADLVAIPYTTRNRRAARSDWCRGWDRLYARRTHPGMSSPRVQR